MHVQSSTAFNHPTQKWVKLSGQRLQRHTKEICQVVRIDNEMKMTVRIPLTSNFGKIGQKQCGSI
jgi:hypothetical protein